MITKTIYQTWKTQNLPKRIEKLHSIMRAKNPNYEHIIYTDDQMNDYMLANCDNELYRIFKKLNHIVAKADLWRYTILFNNGGIYLDIDSQINRPLDELIQSNDNAIITAENNENLFVQWALLFEKNHIILEKTLNNIMRDVHENRNQFDHHALTVVNYAKAIFQVLEQHDHVLDWNTITPTTDITINLSSTSVRIFGVDYNRFFSFKHKYNHLLRNRPKGKELETHWSNKAEQPIYS